MKTKKPDKWKYPTTRGAPVVAFEREVGGLLYARAWTGHGYVKRALGHRDRDRATVYVLEQTKMVRAGEAALADGRVPLSRVCRAYLAHHTPTKKSAGERQEDQRRADMWLTVLGPNKDARKVTPAEWQTFSRDRLSGVVAADGSRPKTPRPVGPRTVQRDLQWLQWTLAWATGWRDADGHPLLSASPVRGKQSFPLPVEKNPKRPVASTDRLEAVLEVAHPDLRNLLLLLTETGRRLSAVLALQWVDVLSAGGPHGSIRWRADTDKQATEWVAPLSPTARETLDRMRWQRPSIGSVYLFPNPTKPGEHVSRRRVAHWLVSAEKKAGLAKQDGSLFHAYRRAWATARKHLPLKDVAHAGGWKTPAVLVTHYQQPDDATLLAVVTGGAALREAK